MAHTGTGTRSELNQKTPQCRTGVRDRNIMPDYQPAKTRKKMRAEGKCGKEDDVDASEKKAVVKFKLQSILIFDRKGKNNSNLPNPIHDTTQEGSKATQEWKEVPRVFQETKAGNKNKSRKES